MKEKACLPPEEAWLLTKALAFSTLSGEMTPRAIRSSTNLESSESPLIVVGVMVGVVEVAVGTWETVGVNVPVDEHSDTMGILPLAQMLDGVVDVSETILISFRPFIVISPFLVLLNQ